MQLGKFNYAKGFASHEYIQFSGETPTGRVVAVDVPSDVIRKIAEIMSVTQHTGHALWHFNNPASEFPCSQCKEVTA